MSKTPFIKYLGVIVLFFLITNTSCKELANQTMPNDIVFFDLKNYISKEVIRLNNENPEIKKTTSLNGNKETKTLKLSDFETEFKIFKETDINKLAWIDKYDADTVYLNNQISSLDYVAKEDKLTTKHLRVEFQNGVVSKIDVKTKATSIVTDVEKHLIYEPNVGYMILSNQRTKGGVDNEIGIEGEFL